MATTVSLKPNAVEISGSTSGTTTLQATAVAGTTTLTLPAATDTLVGKATTDTLTNKTLTSPTITGVATFAAGTAADPAITTTGDTNTGIFFPAADTIAFAEGGAEVARFDSSGNLGLGVTPSANAGVSTLNIANYNRTFSALTMGSNANSAGYVGYNMGNTNTSNTWKYLTADTGNAIYFAGNEFRFMQFASGSAGATTSGTQAMTLNASGGLQTLNTIGVGNTTPSTSGAGITFPATQSASTDANTLDDYEEGTWTPIFTSVGGTPTITYTVQQGSYVKVGKLVYASFYLGTSAISGGSSRLLIGGLPFTNQNVNESDRSCLTFGLISGFSSTTTPTAGILASNTTLIHLYTNNSADARDNKSTDVSCPPASAPGLYGTVMYRAAA
jgi:hypothetical protein